MVSCTAHNVSYVTKAARLPAPADWGCAEPPAPGNMYIRVNLVSLFLWVSAAVYLCVEPGLLYWDQPSLRGR